MTHRILLVDDEPNVLRALERLLRRTGSSTTRPRVISCTHPAEALELAREYTFSIAIADYRMPHMNGVELLARLCLQQPACARVLLSGYTDQVGLIGAINEARISRFMTKPWDDQELQDTVLTLLASRQQQLDEQTLADEARLRRGELSPQALELRRLELLEPGITHVERDAQGTMILDWVPTA
jgi:response regulator RpfG family c-di-GMP phosphodiesterase